MKTTELVCIVCPKGCRLTVTEDNNDYKVTGNQCKRGAEYGVKEITNPTRVVTSTVKVEGSIHRRLPVVTKGAIPKGKIFDAMKVVNSVIVVPPINMGDIIVENLLETGINLVASRSISN